MSPTDEHGRVDTSTLVDAVHRELLLAGEVDTDVLRDAVLSREPLLPPAVLDAVLRRIRSRMEGFDRLDPLLADPSIDEVMVNGGGDVWIERAGRLEPTALRLDHATTFGVVERIVAPLGLRVDRTAPIVDARLDDGSRVNVVVPPIAVDGPLVTIRRFGARRIPLEEMADPGVVAMLQWAVAARANVVVSGGAGAGKTTLLNAVASVIPDGERIVTIEDAAELRLPSPHVVRLEARPATAEGVGEIRIRDLVRTALRMRPDRIVVGEVRSGEAIDMLQAMNTGHDGSLSTCHANSPSDAIRRLETLVLMGDVALPLSAVREQLRSAIDLVVHIARRPDGSRRVVSVAEPSADGELGGSIEMRVLTRTDGGLSRLPERAVRWSAAPSPDPAWITG